MKDDLSTLVTLEGVIAVAVAVQNGDVYDYTYHGTPALQDELRYIIDLPMARERSNSPSEDKTETHVRAGSCSYTVFPFRYGRVCVMFETGHKVVKSLKRHVHRRVKKEEWS